MILEVSTTTLHGSQDMFFFRWVSYWVIFGNSEGVLVEDGWARVLGLR